MGTTHSQVANWIWSLALFGWGKNKKAVDDSEQYCRTMFAGREHIYGKPIPNQVFADPYVYGFLQQLVMHAVTMRFRKAQDPSVIMRAMVSSMDRLTPSFGKAIVDAAVGIANPQHLLHPNYLCGRTEGSQYVVALLTGDQDSQNGQMKNFRDFVARNYLNG